MAHPVVISMVILLLCAMAHMGTGEVVTLTAENFDESVANGEWIIEFYAPWCGNCVKMQPIFETVSKSSKLGHLRFGKVDVEEELALGARFMVSHIPTFYHIHEGRVSPFQASFSSSDMISALFNRKWAAGPAWDGFFSPFSTEAKILYSAVNYGAAAWNAIEGVEKTYGIPTWVTLVVFFLLSLLLPFALALIFLGPGHAEDAPSSSSSSPSPSPSPSSSSSSSSSPKGKKESKKTQ